MLYNPLSHHIPPVLPVTALCLWCHSGQNSQACLECDTDWKGNWVRQNGWDRVKRRENLRGRMLKAMKMSTRWMTQDTQMIGIIKWNIRHSENITTLQYVALVLSFSAGKLRHSQDYLFLNQKGKKIRCSKCQGVGELQRLRLAERVRLKGQVHAGILEALTSQLWFFFTSRFVPLTSWLSVGAPGHCVPNIQ